MQLAIETQGLRRTFGETAAVDALDLAVPAGRVTGFLGPNGSGKTTTIRMLLGLLRPTAGTIAMLGRPMPAQRRAIARCVGAMVETPCHYDHLTGRENLDITRVLLGLDRTAVDRVLDLVDLRHAAGQRVGGYSLGMRQRLGIARALIGEPQLLILDEPVNALDPDGIIEMRRLLSSLARDRGMTVLLSSHLLAEVEQTADYVALIAHGRLLAQGPLADLLGQSGPRLTVGTSDPAAAIAILAQRNIAAASGGQGCVTVTSTADPAWVNALLVHQGLAVSQLVAESPSLERTYLALTGGDDRRAA